MRLDVQFERGRGRRIPGRRVPLERDPFARCPRDDAADLQGAGRHGAVGASVEPHAEPLERGRELRADRVERGTRLEGDIDAGANRRHASNLSRLHVNATAKRIAVSRKATDRYGPHGLCAPVQGQAPRELPAPVRPPSPASTSSRLRPQPSLPPSRSRAPPHSALRPSLPSSQPPACVVLTFDTTLTHAAVDSRHNRAKG